MLSKGDSIKHKKYGQGTIVELEGEVISPAARVKIDFNGDIKTFGLGSLDKFCELSADEKEFIKELNEDDTKAKSKIIAKAVDEIKAKKAKPKKYIDFCENIPITEWEKLLDKINDFRFIYQDKAIVIDNKMIYPSSKIALIDMGKDVQLSELAYGACDMNRGRGSEFDGHKYRYATALEVESIIERLTDVDS